MAHLTLAEGEFTINAFEESVLILCMLLGRLELFTLLVLIQPEFWRSCKGMVGIEFLKPIAFAWLNQVKAIGFRVTLWNLYYGPHSHGT